MPTKRTTKKTKVVRKTKRAKSAKKAAAARNGPGTAVLQKIVAKAKETFVPKAEGGRVPWTTAISKATASLKHAGKI